MSLSTLVGATPTSLSAARDWTSVTRWLDSHYNPSNLNRTGADYKLARAASWSAQRSPEAAAAFASVAGDNLTITCLGGSASAYRPGYADIIADVLRALLDRPVEVLNPSHGHTGTDFAAVRGEPNAHVRCPVNAVPSAPPRRAVCTRSVPSAMLLRRRRRWPSHARALAGLL